jgi:sodium transport system permease protein
MSWYNVRLIFLRELRDQMRDRRTLFMILVLPLLLYPTIGIGMLQFTQLFTDQQRRVVLVGSEYLPAYPPLVARTPASTESGSERLSFMPQLFDVEDEAAQFEIVDVGDEQEAKSMLESGAAQVTLVVPPSLPELIESGQDFRFGLSYKSANEKSRVAYLRLKEAIENWKRLAIQQRLESRGLPRDFANPSAVEVNDIATPQQVAGGLIWAKLFPFLLVVMSLTGAFYPAIDLCAGEKERGTMETLLISPAGRDEIVLGKYFTICVFSVGTAILNLMSMATTGWVMGRQITSLPGHGQFAMLAPPSLVSVCWILLLLLPLAAFFSALGIALAAFARSTKEGQYYLTPLFLVTMPLVLVTVAPGIELNGFNSVIPVTGAALLLKTLIQGDYHLALQYFAPVILPTLLYAVLALRWAIDQFNREEVLFREAERLDLVLWARHVLRDKGPFPSAAESLFCFCIMLMMMWFLGGLLTPPASSSEAVRQAALQRSLIVMQLAFVATPPIIMALMLTTSARQTLMLRRFPWVYLGVAPVLALSLHPIILEMSQFIHRGLTQPKWLTDQYDQLLGGGQPIWWQLTLFGLLPAACEEVAFRGFILNGLLRRVSPATAILISAFLFGFFHVNPQQLLPATVLGCVLGLIATRSGSLLPGIVFHFANNASVLLMANFQDHLGQVARAEGTQGPLFDLFHVLYRQSSAASFQAPYSIAVLTVCMLVATAGLTWLLKQPIRARAYRRDPSRHSRRSGASRGLAAPDFTRLATAGLESLAPERRDAAS